MFNHFMADEMLRELSQAKLPRRRHPYAQLDGYSDEARLIARRIPARTRAEGLVARSALADLSSRVSEKLAVCLEILNCTRESAASTYGADSIEAAQRRLNAILLAHPVLLHPGMRVYVELNDASGVQMGACSVAHAVALTLHGRFPMASDGIDTAELAAFIGHPCAFLGLTFKQRAHWQGLCGVEMTTPLQACVARCSERPGFIASLWELHDLVESRDAPDGRGNLLLASLADSAASHLNLVYGSSFIHSLGLQGPRTAGNEVLRNPTCPEFLQMIAGQPPAVRDDIRNELRSHMHGAIFGKAGGAPAEQIHDAVCRVARGLVQADLEQSEAAGAQWMRSSFSSGLPRVDAAVALAFLRAITQLGVHNHLAFFHSEPMRHIRGRPEAAGWLAAAQAHSVETSMAAAIRRAKDVAVDSSLGAPIPATANVSAPAAPAAAASPNTGRRRSRAV